MKSYGRKIIDYIFKRWTERPAICYEPERKVQADSDRSDIRVFETGLSTQQYGDNRQSTRTAEEEECLRLIKIAKEQGLYIDKSDWGKFGDRRMIATGESIVFLSEDGTTFTKMKSPFAKAPMKHILPEDIIYEHLIHNILFPSTRYRFVGFSEDIKGIRIVLQQRNISDMFQVPSQKTIDDYLINQLGLTKEDRYFYGDEYLAITDVSNVSDNVLCDEDGKLYFIDPIIRLKKSEERYGSIFIEQDVYDSYNCKKQKSHPGSLCKWEAWWKLSPQRYVYFLKLQNFLRINFCKVPCFERRLHIVSEKFGSFCCYSDCFAAKILFYLKNLLINSLFSFILRTFAEHSQ